MKEKTLQEFNVPQLEEKSKFAVGLDEFEEHGQKIRMKEKTLQEFSFPQL